MELTQKGEMVSRLQAKAGQIGKILNNLEKYNHLAKDQKASDRKHSKYDAKDYPKKSDSHFDNSEADQAKKKKLEVESEQMQLKAESDEFNG